MSMPDVTAVFRQEAGDLLAKLEETLLDLGQRPDDRELVDTAFRALHTIKGSGAMFGFDRVAAFTHDFETAFDLVRQGVVPASEDLVSVALAAKDYIRTLIEDPEATDPVIGEAILASLQTLVGAAKASPKDPDVSAPAPQAAQHAGWRIGIGLDPATLRNGTNPLALLDELRELGPCRITPRLDELPVLAELDPETLYLGWNVVLRADCGREAIEDVFMFVLDDMVLALEALGADDLDAAMSAPAPARTVAPAEAPPPVAATTAAAPAAAAPAVSEPSSVEVAVPGGRRSDDRTSSVRVQAERLDELMDRVGELVIAQARLSQYAGQHTDPVLKAIAEEIERLASGLRDTTMGIRMVPIGTLFARFRRLVHDLSRELGKPINFVTSGEDTELDKTMIERLAEPLVHLIRNAIDHGIENPERRVASGKSENGTIELRAEHVGAQVIVSVRDDGGGLDVARIRAKAEENGLVSPGAVLSDHEIHQFLFAPGFSTAKTVSALSGRGVGMDVVKRTIEALRGSIDLSTKFGAGSEVMLRLPLTLAIIEGLLIRVGSGRYVIPLSAVEECVEMPAPGREARGGDFLNIRGDLVPFVRLRELFDADGEPDQHQKIIITAVGGERIGFVADQIIGSHQTVIKSLSKLHASVTMFSGATILGDGSAALILDVAQLVSAGTGRGDIITEAA